MYCLFVWFEFTLARLCVNTNMFDFCYVNLYVNVYVNLFLLLILQNDNSYFNRLVLTIYGL